MNIQIVIDKHNIFKYTYKHDGQKGKNRNKNLKTKKQIKFISIEKQVNLNFF